MKLIVLVILILSIFTFDAVIASDIAIDEKRGELEEVSRLIERARIEIERISRRQRVALGEIEYIDSRKDQTISEIKKLNDELVNTQSEIETINLELDQKTIELNILVNNLESIQEEISRKQRELKVLSELTIEREELMSKRIRVMYMNRSTSYLELMLEAESINELFVRLNIIRSIINFDYNALQELESNRIQLNESKLELTKIEKELESLRSNAQIQKNEIEAKRLERTALFDKLKVQQETQEKLLLNLSQQEMQSNRTLQNLENEKERHERELDELEETSREIESKIQDLIREQERQNSQLRFDGSLMQWPVPGFYRVSSPFGYRTHPVFGTRRMHHGIDIGSNITENGRESIYGRNFVAASDGIVIFTGPFGGYGNTVIVDHGDGITTLYAHGSRILVSVGQNVNRGEPVMTVGSTGVSTGPHAHFEVRVNGTPVDPMPYLRGN